MRRNRLVAEIARLLGSERDLLLAGRYDALPAILSRKEQLFGAPQMASLGQLDLDRIRADVIRNQKLIASARDGVAGAAERLELLRQSMAGFRSYGREGRPEMVSGARPTLERKF
jgi:hypothetical protein